MKANNIILAGIVGTTAFTVFSYFVSKALNEKFEEPEIIGDMFDKAMPDMNEKESQVAGWFTHYLIGVAFAAAYKQLIETTGIKPSVRNGIITGAVSGFPAALTWDKALTMHPVSPGKKNLLYYLQLMAGHVIFGAASFLVLGAFSKKEKETAAIARINPESADSKLSQFATAGS